MACQSSTALDADCFPHILDSIILYAPYLALLRLRTTCAAIKARADKLIMGHALLSEKETYLTAEGSHLPAPELQLINVLDVLPNSSFTRFHPPQALQPDTVRTYEIRDAEFPIMYKLHARRHVHFTSMSLGTEAEMVIPGSIDKLVLNIQWSDTPRSDYINIRPDSYTYTPRLQDFVVIFDCAALEGEGEKDGDGDGEGDGNGQPQSADRVLWPVIHLAYCLWRYGSLARFTLVNLPRPLVPGACSNDVDEKTRQWIVEEFIALEHGFQLLELNQSSIERIGEYVDTIQFIDLKEYASRVGETELALEMDRSTFENRLRVE